MKDVPALNWNEGTVKMTKQEEQIKRIVDMVYIFDISFRPLPNGRWEGAFMDSDGYPVSRTGGESIGLVLNGLEEEAVEYKLLKRREKKSQ